MRGSYSIKYVLPALVPELSYNDLDIKEGGTASNTFLSMINETFGGDVSRKSEINKTKLEIETCTTRQLNLQNSFLDGDITSSDYNEMKSRNESELSQKQIKLDRLKSTKSPFKEYLSKTLPMIENLINCKINIDFQPIFYEHSVYIKFFSFKIK